MVKIYDMIKAKLPLYDHDRCSGSSCSETLTFVFGHYRYQTKPGNVERNLRTKKEPTRTRLW